MKFCNSKIGMPNCPERLALRNFFAQLVRLTELGDTESNSLKFIQGNRAGGIMPETSPFVCFIPSLSIAHQGRVR